jgi:hypothetical protein
VRAATEAAPRRVEALLAELSRLRKALHAIELPALRVIPRAHAAARVGVLQEMLIVLDGLATHPQAVPGERETAQQTRGQVRRQLALETRVTLSWAPEGHADAPAAPVYRLYSVSAQDDRLELVEGEHGTLLAAMEAAGCPAAIEWATAAGVKDFVFTEESAQDVRPRWLVHGDAAAAAYAEVLQQQLFGDRHETEKAEGTVTHGLG